MHDAFFSEPCVERRMRAKALLAVVMCLLASPAFAQALWRDIPAGSTVEQAKQKFPSAVAPADTSAHPGEPSPLLEVSGFKLVDTPFKAVLYFRAGKLEKVILSPTVELPGSEGDLVASKIRDGLTVKYGKPVEDKKDPSKFGTMHGTSWFNKGTKINLVFWQIGNSPGDIYVVYLAPADTSNL
jgi:hypothetical protein